MRSTLAVVAAIIAVASAIPYIRDILAGRSKPNIVSWFTWSLILAVATSAAFASGAKQTALFNAGDLIGTVCVLLLGLKYGIARMTRLDGVCQAGAIAALILWLAFDSPAIAILGSIIVDAIAFIPTFRHAWRYPHEETWQTYALVFIAGLLTLISLQGYTAASLGYPIYLSLFNMLLVVTIIRRRVRLGYAVRR